MGVQGKGRREWERGERKWMAGKEGKREGKRKLSSPNLFNPTLTTDPHFQKPGSVTADGVSIMTTK